MLRVVSLLGDMAYSLYLLHGLLLFVIFNNQVDIYAMRSLSLFQHWLLVLA